MLVVHVDIHVKTEYVDAFIKASLANSSASMKEAGITRFDLIQDRGNPQHFVLVEGYLNDEAAGLHKETAHYQLWRDSVAEMMAEPRSSVKFTLLGPT